MNAHSAKISHEIRLIVGTVLPDAPKECGIVALTEVELSPDNRYATLLISALQQPQLALEYVQIRLPYIQAKLRKLPYKTVPEIRLVHDDRSERGSRIDSLLEES